MTTAAQTRAQAQRQRILAAAEKCFIERGFYAASIANIAELAQMSPGLIYRYFKSKNEIILAIIDQQLQLARAEIQQADLGGDPVERIASSFAPPECGSHQTNAALFLDISAEASRDPDIGAAVNSSDRIMEEELRQWLARQWPAGADAGPVPGLALVLQCLWEGMRVREARQPDFDHKALQDALRQCLPALLSNPDRNK